MARRDLTGVLLVGGASNRFGSPKALARLEGETLAERGWRTLGEICGERIAVGKAGDGLELPFPLVDDATRRARSIVGVVGALRAARMSSVSCCPSTARSSRRTRSGRSACACAGRRAAVAARARCPAPTGTRTLPAFETALEAGRLALREVLEKLRVAVVELDPALLANVNSPEELQRYR